MKVSDMLIAAKAKIEHPRDWVKGTSATTYSGKIVSVSHPGATCFCSIGATMAVELDMMKTGRYHPEYASTLQSEAVDELRQIAIHDDHFKTIAKKLDIPFGFTSVAHLNDSPAIIHANVMKLFDKAILSAQNHAR